MITSYEIAASHTDGRSVPIGYTPRRSLPGLIAAVRHHGTVCDIIGLGGDGAVDFGRGRNATIKYNGWTVGFTGRTKLDAKREG